MIVGKAGRLSRVGDLAQVVRRRGFIAAAAGLITILVAKEPEKVAEAADGANLIIGNTGNAATSPTGLGYNNSNAANPGFIVNSQHATGGPAIRAISANDSGVYATTNNGQRAALRGESLGNAGIGVQGSSVNNVGVIGSSKLDTGVFGANTRLTSDTPLGVDAGIFGLGSQAGQGVIGASDRSYGVRGQSNSGIGAAFTSSGNDAIQCAAPQGRNALYAIGAVTITGDLNVSGMKSAVIPVSADGTHVRVFCQESPQPWFEDFGDGQVTNGAADVRLDPGYVRLVKPGSLRIFLTSLSPFSFYVKSQDDDGFMVSIMPDNTGTYDPNRITGARFSYRVVALRGDIDSKRLPTVHIDPVRANHVRKMVTDVIPRPNVRIPTRDNR